MRSKAQVVLDAKMPQLKQPSADCVWSRDAQDVDGGGYCLVVMSCEGSAGNKLDERTKKLV